MKTFSFSLFIIVSALLLSFKNQFSYAGTTLGDYAISVEKQKMIIDQQITKHKKHLVLFAKIPGKKIPVPIIKNKWPDKVEESYNILKDSTGRIIFIASIPFSESGDWYIEYRHYFDNTGHTIAFERVTNSFDDETNGGVIYEKQINYYSQNFKLDHKRYTLENKSGKAIKNIGHIDMYHYPYHIYKTVNDCIKAYKIGLSKD